MSMDLWYDLAARELPAPGDEDVLEKLKISARTKPGQAETEAEPAEAVDFF